MELAEKWNIVEYPSPAGGCKLTEPNYSKRLKDLLHHKEDVRDRDLELLKIGRHFRVGANSKIISTRTAAEAEVLKKLLTKSDTIFLAADFKGSMVIITGEPTEEDIELAGKVTARYSKGKDEEFVTVKYGKYGKPSII